MTFIKHMLTGIDNQTVDPARVWGCMGIAAFILYAGYDVWCNKKFDMQAFGTGFGLTVAGSGLAVQLKAKTEPGQ